MKAADLRKLSAEELGAKITELQAKVQDLRLQKFMGGEMNTAVIGTTKKDLARVLTVMNEQKSASKKEGKK